MSTDWQLLIGRLVCTLTGALACEIGSVELGAFSLRSVLALGLVVVFGSWLAFTAYACLLQNAPLPMGASYAHVNPLAASCWVCSSSARS